MGRPPAGSPGTPEFRARAIAWAERSRLDQDLPAKLTDPDVLDQVARLLTVTATDEPEPPAIRPGAARRARRPKRGRDRSG